MRLCTVTNCGKKYLAKGYCGGHYSMVKKYGKVVASPYDSRPSIVEGDIARIPLGIDAKDGYATVDKKFAWLDKYKWSLLGGYAVSNVDGSTRVKMHRMIMDFPLEMEIDHKDMDRLNNTLSNLRICSRAENMRNEPHKSTSVVPYKGVSISHGKFLSRIQTDKKQICLGMFATAIEAARAYDKAAIRLHGEFARLNNV